jgi:hypothetical protein
MPVPCHTKPELDQRMANHRALIDALEDPQDDTAAASIVCPFMLMSWTYSFFCPPSFDILGWKKFRNTDPLSELSNNTLTLVIKYLARPRSIKEQNTLLNTTCDCTEDQCADELHVLAVDRMEQASAACDQRPGASWIQGCIGVIDAGDWKGKNSYGGDLRPAPLVRGTHWPRRPDDGLPRGSENTIRGLLSWYRADIKEHVRADLNSFLCNYVKHYGPRLLPYVVSSHDLLVKGTIDTYRACYMKYCRKRIRTGYLEMDDPAWDEIMNISNLLSLFVHEMPDWCQARVMVSSQASQLLYWCNLVRGLMPCAWIDQIGWLRSLPSCTFSSGHNPIARRSHMLLPSRSYIQTRKIDL